MKRKHRIRKEVNPEISDISEIIETDVDVDLHGKSLFRTEYIEHAYRLSLLGLSDEHKSKFFNVTRKTFLYWQEQVPEFKDAVWRGKEIADGQVANAMFNKAVGYNRTEDHITQHNGVVAVTKYTKHYPADTTAGIFWLKNKQRDTWSDMKRISSTLDVNIRQEREMQQFSDSDLEQLELIATNRIPALKECLN